MNNFVSVKCVTPRTSFPNQITVGKNYFVDKSSKYRDIDGDTYVTVYEDVNGNPGDKIGNMLMSHFEEDKVMNKKYDVWFCHCGRVQFMSYELWDWMAEDCEHRRVIQVCQNCGAAVMHFLTDNGEGFDMNGHAITNTEIDTSDGLEYKFILNHGEKVLLKCGYYADSFQNNKFISWEYCEKIFGTTYLPVAEKKDPDCCKVDTQALISEINDEDKLRSMSGYAVPIDWTGTPYDWRKK